LHEPAEWGKHIGLDEVHEQQLLDHIWQNTEKDKPITRGEIMNYCLVQVKIKFTRGGENSFVFQHSGVM
jgi:hypothetical protein